jgi:8-oxo-dGTP diphosphatase
VLIRNGDRILSTRRSDNDDELPGIWGLPAGTARAGETSEDVIVRIGRDKLGAELNPVRRLAFGAQDRPKYQLEMQLWEASMKGNPTYAEWQWGTLDVLRPGIVAGSLCCELAVKSDSRVS